jgi:hypothetical protein
VGVAYGLNIDVDGYAIDDAPLAGDHDAISAMSAAQHQCGQRIDLAANFDAADITALETACRPSGWKHHSMLIHLRRDDSRSSRLEIAGPTLIRCPPSTASKCDGSIGPSKPPAPHFEEQHDVFAEQLERLRPLLEFVELRSRVPEAAKQQSSPQRRLTQAPIQDRRACTAAMLQARRHGVPSGLPGIRFAHTTSRYGFLAVIICVDRDAIRLISYSQ